MKTKKGAYPDMGRGKAMTPFKLDNFSPFSASFNGFCPMVPSKQNPRIRISYFQRSNSEIDLLRNQSSNHDVITPFPTR